MCHLYLDGTDPDALTHGEMAGRKQAMHAIHALQASCPDVTKPSSAISG
jgi:hypothetical protein